MRSKQNLLRATAIAVALMATGSAMAAENLYGGGATFPVVPYVGPDYQNPDPTADARLSTNAGNGNGGFQIAGISTVPPLPATVFQAYSAAYANQVSYCATGSGFGKTTLNGVVANQLCRDYSTSPLGFSSPNIVPDFIGTDAPISTADYTAFKNGPNYATRTGIVQIPTIAGAIALPYNSAVNVPVVNLTTEQVCRIFSAKITDWSNVLQSGTGAPVGSGPIRIVYRSDGSGTTFAFTSYLAAKCNGQFTIPAGFFMPNQNFASAITGGVAIYAAATGGSGNPGVVNAVLANDDALGYADFGEVDTLGADYATVNGFDPANFGKVGTTPTPLNIAASFLLRATVLDGAVKNPAPTPPALAVRRCLFLVDPAVAIPNRYPIAAFTYLAGYNTGNGTALHQDAIKKLYRIFYDASIRPVLPDGFAYLDGQATFGNQIRNALDAVSGEPGCVF